ncbi:Hypothetical_protein [Hexamita inflata]|uniref:Hypothetical_protein n=1 Tax=Hexamita inflata TaxID=28002 RepID=A0AA86N6G0_9EUKA|nr:Hypothetical protein HINF_LOCUS1281 [Hexamita inflata]
MVSYINSVIGDMFTVYKKSNVSRSVSVYNSYFLSHKSVMLSMAQTKSQNVGNSITNYDMFASIGSNSLNSYSFTQNSGSVSQFSNNDISIKSKTIKTEKLKDNPGGIIQLEPEETWF